MTTVTFDALINADHKLIVQLPDDIPVGAVKLTIEPVANGTSAAPAETTGERPPLTRERAREILLAAGLLSTAKYAPDDATDISEAEHTRLANLFADESRTMLDLINEDRGDY